MGNDPLDLSVHRLKPQIRQNEPVTTGNQRKDFWVCIAYRIDRCPSLAEVGGRNFLVALRLYGTGVEFFDQTWKPDDVVKVK